MENSIGLWEKTSKNNNIYYSGKVEIEGKKYIVNLFKVDKGENTKRPDYNMIIREEKKEEIKIEPSKAIGENPMADEVFANFGNNVNNEEIELAF